MSAPKGEQVGIVSITEALRLAQEADLDLVEVAPTARPPVCKLMDYGKFKYETALKERESRKNQTHTIVKEIKLRPKIDPHDYGTKKGHVERFLKAGDKVKVTIMFRGREQSRPELGFRLLQKLADDVTELGFVESQPKQDGRNMIMVIGPHRRPPERKAEAKPAPGSPSSSVPCRARATRPRLRSTQPRPRLSPRSRLPGTGADRRVETYPGFPGDGRRGPHADSVRAAPPSKCCPAASGTSKTELESSTMPKMKTHSGTAKRFKITGSGKIMRLRANRQHLFEHKSSRVTRRLCGEVQMAKSDVREIKRLLGR